jgi:hypothetical protein
VLKIDNTPQAIVWSTGILAIAGLVGFLAWAGWQTETIIGFATLALGLIAAQAANARKTAVVEAKTDNQTQDLQTLLHQTNGGLSATVADAVEKGIARAVIAYRADQASAYGRGRDDEAAGV